MMDDHYAIELFTGRGASLRCAAPARIIFSGSVLNNTAIHCPLEELMDWSLSPLYDSGVCITFRCRFFIGQHLVELHFALLQNKKTCDWTTSVQIFPENVAHKSMGE